MKILSLFDGISCGRVALERAGIPVERYVAYEIDQHAKTISAKNYPDIEQCGDVFDGDYTQYQGFDLLMGGSPCTYWSTAKSNRETTCEGEGYKLFMEYVRALRESGCRWFLYENNYTIHQNIKSAISAELGVQPIMINSALVSAQSRKRCYWTNIPGITQPKDRGILLKDVLERGGVYIRDKAYTLRASAPRKLGESNVLQHIKTNGHFGYQGVLEPISVLPINGAAEGKARTLKAQYHKTGIANFVTNGGFGATGVAEQYDQSAGSTVYKVEDKKITIKGEQYPVELPDGYYIIRKLLPIECERLQTLPEGYTEGVSPAQRYKTLGNGWTVEVIAHILKHIKEVKN